VAASRKALKLECTGRDHEWSRRSDTLPAEEKAEESEKRASERAGSPTRRRDEQLREMSDAREQEGVLQ